MADQPITPRRLKNQDPVAWIAMSVQTLEGASQIAKDRRDLLTRQTDTSWPDSFREITRPHDGPAEVSWAESYVGRSWWRSSLEWSEIMLVALSAEQSLKAIAILRSEDASCLKTHDLSLLLDQIGTVDQDSIITAVADVKNRTRMVREFGRQNLMRPKTRELLQTIVEAHRDLFTVTRYSLAEGYRYSRPPGFRRDFWHIALGFQLHAKRLGILARREGGLSSPPPAKSGAS